LGESFLRNSSGKVLIDTYSNSPYVLMGARLKAQYIYIGMRIIRIKLFADNGLHVIAGTDIHEVTHNDRR
jgi:hypothetical protein